MSPCEVPTGRARVVRLDFANILLVNIRGEIHAFADGCVNCSASFCGARVHGDQVSCPLCGWAYDVPPGALTGTLRLRLDRYAARISGSSVEITE